YTLLALDGLVRCFRLYYLADQRTLHSLPTRRSSDLPRQSRHGAGEVQCLFRQYSGFLRFTADIDLHQNVQIRHGIRALLAEATRSEEHTSELQSRENLVCRLLLETKKTRHRSHGRTP